MSGIFLNNIFLFAVSVLILSKSVANLFPEAFSSICERCSLGISTNFAEKCSESCSNIGDL